MQKAVLSSWLIKCSDLYNAALQQRREAWKRAGKTLDYMAQTKELTDLRAADESFAAVSAQALRSALRRLDHAFKAFFRRVKRGDTPGYPRFRNRRSYDSLGIGRVPPEGNRVRIPNIGFVKFHRYRPLAGVVRYVEIIRTGTRWWVTFSCEIGHAPDKVPVASSVGIDLGLTSFLVLSDGGVVANPRYLRSGEEKLIARQRRFDRCMKGSARRKRAHRLVARAHEHIHNQRIDHGRKLACDLFSRYDLVAHEALDIEGMVGGNLSKSINDAGWGLFLRCLSSKAESAGKWVIPVDPRGTSQRCSKCQTVVKKTLRERVHTCPNCGLVLGRDHNAALNILALGTSVEIHPDVEKSTQDSTAVSPVVS